MNEFQRPIAVDLFAGAGGISLGFEQAGFDVLAAVEIDPIHCATHEYNFPDCAILCQSVIETTGEQIRQASTIGDREIDVVFGGPPCQGFSTIGKRALDDPRNALVFHFLRLIVELQPKYFVMENVRGMTFGKHISVLLEIIDKFKANGYRIEENYQVLNAANYGVPQKRERLFLIGSRADRPLPHYPAAIVRPPQSKTSPTATVASLPEGPTVWDAIGDLPEVENYPELLDRDWAIGEYGAPSAYASYLRGLRRCPTDYAYPRLFDRQRITASARSQHTPESIARFAATPPGRTESISRFRRLDPNGTCNTLRAGTPSNRGAYTSPRPIHPVTPRCITVREAARIHSYPDWFGFHATKWHGFRQVGNSVPPLLAKAVASEIRRALAVEVEPPQGAIACGDRALLELTMSQAAERYQVDPHTIEPRLRRRRHPPVGTKAPGLG
jgi:DNA (cytosine-5)-methyltransferase 1